MLASAILLGSWASAVEPDPRIEWEVSAPEGLQFGSEPQRVGSALRYLYVRCDLRCPHLELIVLANRSDQSGHGGGLLRHPAVMAAGFLAAINANSFSLPGYSGRVGDFLQMLVPETPVTWHGWIAVDGQVWRGEPASGMPTFALSSAGIPSLQESGFPEEVRWGVAGFHLLTPNNCRESSQGENRNARTLLGLTPDHRYLFLAVAEGVRKLDDSTDGATIRESAQFLFGLGCDRVLNLDGGGSSFIGWRDSTGSFRQVNRPSNGVTRLVPVILGIRSRAIPMRDPPN